MKVYQVRIDIAKACKWIFKDHPSAKSLCEKIKDKMDPLMLDKMAKGLAEKGWIDQPLPPLVVLDIGDPFGYLSITTLDLDVIE
jgi:hypothetical protein